MIKLKAQLSQEGRIESVLVCDSARPTTRKVRFVSEYFSTHMLRADWELASPASGDIEQKLIDVILPQLLRANTSCTALSDYAKGVLTARVIRNVIDAARKLGKRVIVDPKSANFAIYRGATLLTPNRKELEATRSGADSEKSVADVGARRNSARGLRSHAGDAERKWHDAGAAQRRGCSCVGPSGQGAGRFGRGRHRRRGTGGVTAAGADWETAVRMANAAAAVAVSKKGTAIVTPAGITGVKDLPYGLSRGRRKDRRCRRRPRCISFGLAQNRGFRNRISLSTDASIFCIRATSRF